MITSRTRNAMLTWPSAISPWIPILLFGALAFQVRSALGHWPRPMTDSVLNPSVRMLDQLAGPALLLALVGFLCRFLFAGVSAWKPSPAIARFQWLLFGIGWLVIVGVVWLDPTRFVEWYLD